jgi:hypothetical protein
VPQSERFFDDAPATNRIRDYVRRADVGYVAAQGVNRTIGFEDQQQLSDLISKYSYAWDAL